ncbi:MAG: cadherin-like domain-containing protein [Acidobacteriota bacterium]
MNRPATSLRPADPSGARLPCLTFALLSCVLAVSPADAAPIPVAATAMSDSLERQPAPTPALAPPPPAFARTGRGPDRATAVSVAPRRVLDGQTVPVFEIRSDSGLDASRFTVEDGDGSPLGPKERRALLDDLSLFLDDGSRRFEAGFDRRLAGAVLDAAEGSLTVRLDGRGLNERSALFAVATFSSFASAATPDQLRFALKLPDGAVVKTPRIDVNDMPVALDDRVVVPEDSGAFNGHVIDGSLGGADLDEEGDPLTATLVRGPRHGGLLRSLAADGRFTYVPKSQWNGTDSFTYRLSDGLSQSNVATVTLTVRPVNDPPTFELDDRVTVPKSSGAHQVDRFARRLRAGPLDELAQHLRFAVLDITHPSLFLRLPRLDGRGSLRFTLRDGAAGTSTVTVVLRDDGGLEDGGRDTSHARTFLIEVTDSDRRR